MHEALKILQNEVFWFCLISSHFDGKIKHKSSWENKNKTKNPLFRSRTSLKILNWNIFISKIDFPNLNCVSMCVFLCSVWDCRFSLSLFPLRTMQVLRFWHFILSVYVRRLLTFIIFFPLYESPPLQNKYYLIRFLLWQLEELPSL